MFNITNDKCYSKNNFNERVRFLVIHYTAVPFSQSIQILTQENVSAHYLIPTMDDEEYSKAGFKEIEIFNLVEESKRAWHSGASYWQDRSNINDSSIGIELVGFCKNNLESAEIKFCDQQIKATIFLCKKIIAKYKIQPNRVVGHSDISIGRKKDPGNSFPWEKLYKKGVGAWYEEDAKLKYQRQLGKKMIEPDLLIKKIEEYGYRFESNSESDKQQQIITAFQRHFRPEKFDGNLDIETAAIACALHDKYVKKK